MKMTDRNGRKGCRMTRWMACIWVLWLGLAMATSSVACRKHSQQQPDTADQNGAADGRIDRGAKPATAGLNRSPWADAKVGDFVRYRTGEGPGAVEVVLEVINADDAQVVVRQSASLVDATGEPDVRELTYQRHEPAKGMEWATDAPVGTTRLAVGGVEVACDVYDRSSPTDAAVTRTYVCPQIPGWVARVERISDNQVQATMQVEEFRRN